MNTKHTPGPWRIAGTNSGLFIAGAVPGYLAEVRNCGSGDIAANARLIAAAPEMLAALRDVETMLESFPADWSAELAPIRAILARVDG